MAAEADFKNAVWYFDTNGPNGQRITGGGVCIDPEGFVLTVAHVVSFDGVEQQNIVIEAGPYDTADCYEIVRVQTHNQFDLALVQVKRVDKNDKRPIPHVDLGHSVQVDFGEDIFGFVHQGGLTYSIRSGYTCYPLPEQVHLPDIDDTTTIDSYQSAAFRESCLRGAPDGSLFNKNDWGSSENYRTMGSVISYTHTSLFDYHPRLPMVQTKGYFPASGTSGCPLFRKSNNDLIGLASCQMDDYLFLIPVNFLRKYFDEVK